MYRCFKRVFDVTSATLLLIAISPILLILVILVKVNLGSPIIFTQERAGKGMQPFKLMKFRSMSNATDAQGNLLPDHDRVTRFGKFLRSTSLDELPELINIIRGDMSVIGPRPLPVRYNPYYNEGERARFNVRMGLVTPDSVDPDPIISWDKQFKYEAEYASNMSFCLDCKIIIGVFRILLRRNQTNYGSFERKPLDVERQEMRNLSEDE